MAIHPHPTQKRVDLFPRRSRRLPLKGEVSYEILREIYPASGGAQNYKQTATLTRDKINDVATSPFR